MIPLPTGPSRAAALCGLLQPSSAAELYAAEGCRGSRSAGWPCRWAVWRREAPPHLQTGGGWPHHRRSAAALCARRSPRTAARPGDAATTGSPTITPRGWQPPVTLRLSPANVSARPAPAIKFRRDPFAQPFAIFIGINGRAPRRRKRIDQFSGNAVLRDSPLRQITLL